ncbi:MAG: metal ABC transporter permease [Planctomycetaceae bacterium]
MPDLWPSLLRFWSFQDRAVQTAAAGVLLLAVSCGTLGCFIVLRRLSLLGDSLGHAVLPGVCLGFLVTWTKSPLWIFLGAVAAALAGSGAITFIQRHSRLKPDVALGLVLSGFFGLGIVLLTRLQNFAAGNQSGLNQFLFGQASAIGERDLWLMGSVTVMIVAAVALFYKELTLTSFDAPFATALGLPTRGVHYLLMALTALAIVISLQAVGVVLLSAMLIIPAATALLLTDRLHVMIGLSVLFACLGGLLGLSASYLGRNLPTGPFVVVTLSAVFSVAWLFSPRYGVVARRLRVWRRRRRTARENALKRLYLEIERQYPDARDHAASLAALAQTWQTSVPQLAKTLRPLARHGWIELSTESVRISPRGAQRAAELVRNYRLWEQFLTEEVRLPADHTERDAEDIEHLLTPELARELEERLQQSSERRG